MICKRCCWGVFKPRDIVSGAWELIHCTVSAVLDEVGSCSKVCVRSCFPPTPLISHTNFISWSCHLSIDIVCIFIMYAFETHGHILLPVMKIFWGLTTVTLAYNLHPCRSKCIYKNHTHLHSSTTVEPHFMCVKDILWTTVLSANPFSASCQLLSHPDVASGHGILINNIIPLLPSRQPLVTSNTDFNFSPNSLDFHIEILWLIWLFSNLVC
jgi:hypothetical protein